MKCVWNFKIRQIINKDVENLNNFYWVDFSWNDNNSELFVPKFFARITKHRLFFFFFFFIIKLQDLACINDLVHFTYSTAFIPYDSWEYNNNFI